MTLLGVSWIRKKIKDDAFKSVKIGNFIKIILEKKCSKMMFLRVSLLTVFKDDTCLSVIECINQR